MSLTPPPSPRQHTLSLETKIPITGKIEGFDLSNVCTALFIVKCFIQCLLLAY